MMVLHLIIQALLIAGRQLFVFNYSYLIILLFFVGRIGNRDVIRFLFSSASQSAILSE